MRRPAALFAALVLATGCSLAIDPDGVKPRVVTAVAVTPASPTIAKGRTQQLAATATWSDGASEDVTARAAWSSGAPAIASVSSGGLVTAAGVGTAAVTAAFAGQSGSAAVSVGPAVVTAVAVTPAAPSLPKGTTAQLAAAATYSDATTADVTAAAAWSSSAPAVATVTDAGTKGTVTAAATGTAVVSAAIGGVTGTTTVTVTPAAVTSIAVTPASTASLAKGLTLQLAATATYTDATTGDVTATAAWTTSSGAIAAVSAAGLVTAAGQGAATITAALSGKSGTASVTVTPPVLATLAVSPSPLAIPLGLHQQLAATGTYTDGSTQDVTAAATWTSSNGAIATVSNGPGDRGVLRTVAQGSATATAAVGAVSAKTVVTVGAVALVRVQIVNVGTSLLAGTSAWAYAVGVYSDGATRDLTHVAAWTSTDPTVATVSTGASGGAIRTVAAGATTLSAAYGGVSGSLAVTVHAPLLVTVQATPAGLEIPAGQAVAMRATALYDDGTAVDVTATAQWTTSDPAVATVSAGVVTGVSAGGARVTAAVTGVSDGAAVRVTSATVTRVSALPPTVSATVPWEFDLVAIADYSDGGTFDVTASATWSSTDATIAKVAAGHVTPLAAGSVAISAAFLGKTGTSSVTVSAAQQPWVSLSYPPPIPAAGTFQLRATEYLSDGTTQDVTSQMTGWTSANVAVAAVDGAGKVTGVTAGQAQISAVLGGRTYYAYATVTAASVTALTLSPATITAPVGGTMRLTASVTYSDGMKIDVNDSASWGTSNGAVVALSPASPGIFTAVGAGSANVTALLFGKSGTSAVTVKSSPVVSVALSPGSASKPAGEYQDFVATATLQDASTLDLTPFASWSTSQWCAWIVAPGRVVGSRQGMDLVSAAFGDAIAVATFTALAPTLKQVNVSAVSSLYAGQKTQAGAYAVYGDGNWVDVTSQATWSSSNTAVATVSDATGTKGLVAGVATGTANVTATYAGTASSPQQVQVLPGTLTSVALDPPGPIAAKIAGNVSFRLVGIVAGCTAAPCPTADVTQLATWTTSAPNVAAVSDAVGSKGSGRALATGSATISAVYGSLSSSAAVTVGVPALVALSASPGWWGDPGGSCSRGGTVTLPSAIDVALVGCAQYDNGRWYVATEAASWQAADPTIATVSNVAGSKGVASIAMDPARATGPTCSAGVCPAGISLSFGGTTASVGLGVSGATLWYLYTSPADFDLSAGVVAQSQVMATYGDSTVYNVTPFATWTVADAAVATAVPDPETATETVTAVAPGATTLRVSYRGAFTERGVDVDGRAVASLQGWFTAQPTIPVGPKIPVVLYAVDAAGRTWDVTRAATFTSSNPAAATASGGSVTGVAPGYATIEASYGGASTSLDVEVSPATLATLALDHDYDAGPVGVPLPRFTANATYSDGQQYDVSSLATWSLTSTTVAAPSGATGAYRIIGAGSTTVTAKFGGQTATARLVGF